jgi:peptidyl-prolyl cis-trans isomerase D
VRIEDSLSMLKYFRDRRSMGWLVGSGLLVLVIFAFIAFYVPDFMGPQGAGPTGAVAWVDGEAITTQEFLTAYRAQEAQYRAQLGPQFSPQLMRQLGFDNAVLQELTRNKMLALEADRQGFAASDDEVREIIMNHPSFQQGGTFIGQQAYLSLLQRTGMTAAEFETQLRTDIVRQKLQSFVTDGIVIDPIDLEDEYRKRNEQADLDYVFVRSADFAAETEITDEQARQYYEAHKNDFARPVQRRARFITFTPQLFSATVTVTEREIERYYNQNAFQYESPEQVAASHILFKTEEGDVEQARQRAEAVLAQARSGADFAELAREHSEDTSASSGGDLGFFARGQMVPEFENVAFSLGIDEISDIVETQFGFHIIKVTGRQNAETRALEDVRDEIQTTIVQMKSTEMMEDAVDSAADKLAAAGSIDPLVAEYELLVPQETPWFAETETLPQLGNSVEAASVAFDIDLGDVSPPVRLGNGYAFLQVLEERPAGVPDFEEVTTLAKERFGETQSLARAEERARELRSILTENEQSLPEGVALATSETFFRGSTLPGAGRSAAVQTAAFANPLDEFSEPLKTENGYVVLRVRSRTGFSRDDFEEQKDRFREQLTDEQRFRVWNGFVSSLQSRYTIRVDWRTIRSLTG